MLKLSKIRENVELYRKCTTNDSDHSKTAFILGVPSTKGHPEGLPPVKNAEPMFLSQKVRKAAVLSCSPGPREHFFSQKAVATPEASRDFGSASAPQLCCCFSPSSCCLFGVTAGGFGGALFSSV